MSPSMLFLAILMLQLLASSTSAPVVAGGKVVVPYCCDEEANGVRRNLTGIIYSCNREWTVFSVERLFICDQGDKKARAESRYERYDLFE